MPSNLSTVAYIYKTVYAGGVPADVATRDHALLSMLAKKGGFTGTTFNYAVQYGAPQGISGAFSNAQSQEASSKGVQFAAQRKKKYGVVVLDGESLMASSNDDGAFAELVTLETDKVLMEHGDTLGFEIYRDGTCTRGRRASASTNVITMTVADDARNFKVGMTVGASANADLSTPRAGNTTVAAVDEDAGTVTLTSAAAITSFADNDYMFRVGDPNTGIEGLEAINPLTLTATAFRGIDRTVDSRRLGGVRVNDTSASILENIGLVGVKIAQSGQKADCVFLNPIRMWQIARELGAKVEYDNGGGTANYAFQYIMVHTPAGAIKCYSDADCPTNRGRVLNLSTNYLKHLGDFPGFIQDDGNFSLRATSSDSIEARTRSLGNLIQTHPAANGVFAI